MFGNAEIFVAMAQSIGLRIHVLSTLPKLEPDHDPDKIPGKESLFRSCTGGSSGTFKRLFGIR